MNVSCEARLPGTVGSIRFSFTNTTRPKFPLIGAHAALSKREHAFVARIFACPVISGLSSQLGFSICVVKYRVFCVCWNDDRGATGITGVSLALALPVLFPSRRMQRNSNFVLP